MTTRAGCAIARRQRSRPTGPSVAFQQPDHDTLRQRKTLPPGGQKTLRPSIRQCLFPPPISRARCCHHDSVRDLPQPLSDVHHRTLRFPLCTLVSPLTACLRLRRATCCDPDGRTDPVPPHHPLMDYYYILLCRLALPPLLIYIARVCFS